MEPGSGLILFDNRVYHVYNVGWDQGFVPSASDLKALDVICILTSKEIVKACLGTNREHVHYNGLDVVIQQERSPFYENCEFDFTVDGESVPVHPKKYTFRPRLAHLNALKPRPIKFKRRESGGLRKHTVRTRAANFEEQDVKEIRRRLSDKF